MNNNDTITNIMSAYPSIMSVYMPAQEKAIKKIGLDKDNKIIYTHSIDLTINESIDNMRTAGKILVKDAFVTRAAQAQHDETSLKEIKAYLEKIGAPAPVNHYYIDTDSIDSTVLERMPDLVGVSPEIVRSDLYNGFIDGMFQNYNQFNLGNSSHKVKAEIKRVRIYFKIPEK